MSKKLIFLISLCLVLGLAGNASAISWDAGGVGNLWKTPENWNPNEVPVTPQPALILMSGETCVIDSTHTGADTANPWELRVKNVTILDVNGGTLLVPYWFKLNAGPVVDTDDGTILRIGPGSRVDCNDQFFIAVSKDASMIMTGGVVNANHTQNQALGIGWGNTNVNKGVLDISGGTINVTKESLCIGRNPVDESKASEVRVSGTAVINTAHDVEVGGGGGAHENNRQGKGKLFMNGGTINIGRNLDVPGGAWDGTPPIDNSGWAYLDGGTINCNNFARHSDANHTEIHFTDNDDDHDTGLLIVNGNKLGQVGEWVDNNWMKAYDSNDPRNVAAEYDSDTGKTTIQGVHPNDIDYAIAYAPRPMNYATAVADMNMQIMVSWQPGSWVGDPNGHDVYFGESFDDVNEATRATAVIYKGVQDFADVNYGPVTVDLSTTYYWRIDEIDDFNGASPWEGDVWMLDVPDYLIVDEFELYDATGYPVDYGDANLRDTWDDYWAGDQWYSAAEIFLETDTAKGAASMKLNYDNDGSAGPLYYSETWRTYATSQDWTTGGVKAIALSFYGDDDNTINQNENLYVRISDGTVEKVVNCDCEPNDLTNDSGTSLPGWQECNIALEDFTGVDMNEVIELGIGIGERTGPYTGSEGYVYIDNIRLYEPRCVPKFAQREDFTGDCITDYNDLDIMTDDWLIDDYNLVLGLVGRWDFNDGSGSTALDSSGKGRHGTLWDMNTATCWVAGEYGGALQFDPNGNSPPDPCSFDLVAIPASDDFALTEKGITYAAWVNTTTAELIKENGPQIIAKADPCRPAFDGYDVAFEISWGRPAFRTRFGQRLWGDLPAIADNTWHHVAVTVEFNTDGDKDSERIYVDGNLTGGQTKFDRQKYDTPGFGIVIGAIGKGESKLRPPTHTTSIDDAQIYNRPLSAAEIVTVKNGGTAPDVDVYFPPGRDNIPSIADLYTEEAVNDRVINFRDYAFLVDDWLEESEWP